MNQETKRKRGVPVNGAYLKSLRDESKMSVAAFADQLGIRPRTLQKAEASGRLDKTTIKTICENLDIPEDKLLAPSEPSMFLDLRFDGHRQGMTSQRLIHEYLVDRYGTFVTVGVRLGSYEFRMGVSEDTAEKIFEDIESGTLEEIGLTSASRVNVVDALKERSPKPTHSLRANAGILFVISAVMMKVQRAFDYEVFTILGVLLTAFAFDLGGWCERKRDASSVSLAGLLKLLLVVVALSFFLVPVTTNWDGTELRVILLVSGAFFAWELARRLFVAEPNLHRGRFSDVISREDELLHKLEHRGLRQALFISLLIPAVAVLAEEVSRVFSGYFPRPPG